ncbi:hypothetical protein FSP39_006018 [Pinctada imbricata]|uniref:G-protein coupled receptors family 1 profile domain-containing protein n=1 Tax=Pinctada imbricata TaxID=66713 RepID=A0AA88YCM4_PINIB|nr:hypothetical protein FSP39_006018 [Pinctada imbricata]
MTSCDINSTEIAFTDSGIPSFIQVTRWLKFCKTVYVNKCDLYTLRPPLGNISYMLSQSTHEDCFNTKHLTAYCISIILSVVTILANTVILAAFVKSRKRLISCSNIPIISLAISDLLAGVTFLYSSTWNILILTAGYKFDIKETLYYVQLRTNKYLCLTLDGPGFVFASMMSSVLSLGIIASDRYLAIFYSYQYPNWISIPKVATILIASWVISILVGILPLFGWNNWQDTSTCQLTKVMHYGYLALWSTICFLSGLIILFIYIRIFVLARKHSRQIESSKVSNTTSSYSLPSTSDSSTSGDLNKLVKSARKQSQVALCTAEAEIAQNDVDRKESQGRKVGFKDENEIAETSFNQDSPENKKDEIVVKLGRMVAWSETDLVPGTSSGVETRPRSISTPDLIQKNAQELDSGIFESINLKEITPADQNHDANASSYTNSSEPRQSVVSSTTVGRMSLASTKSHRRNRRPTMKAVRTTAMILGAFYVSWTPLLAYLLAFRNNYDNLTVYYLAVVTQLNSIFNPIMYGYRQSDIKRAVKSLFSCLPCLRPKS